MSSAQPRVAELSEQVSVTRRRRKEAEDLVKKLEKKIESQERRNRLQRSQEHRGGEISQRRKEVQASRDQARAVLEARRLEEERQRLAIQQQESHRKEQSRQAMYDLFSDKRKQVKEAADQWSTINRAHKNENRAFDLYRKENALDQRQEHVRRRNRAIEEVERNRKAAHEVRMQEIKESSQFIEARNLERARTAQEIARDVHHSMNVTRSLRAEIERKRQEERERELQQARDIELAELAILTSTLERLQRRERGY